jgi:hypothetical protein
MTHAVKITLVVAAIGAASCKSVTEGSGARIVSVTIATPSVILSQAETQPVAVTIQDADGNTLQNVSGVTWESADNAVVSVTQAGQIRGVGLGGPVNVTVSVEGKSATTSVTVVPARIDITPGTGTLALGGSRQLSGLALDAEGNPISGAGLITWSSSNNAVATVSSTGLLTPVAAGATVISAAVAGRTSQLNIEVGVASQYDGHWAGNSATTGPFPRTFPVAFDVVFGTVRSFSLTFSAGGAGCPLNLVALSAGSVLIVNNAFQLTLEPPPRTGATAASISATFASPSTMTATQTEFRFGAYPGCPVTGGGTTSFITDVGAGTIAAAKQ